MVDVLFGQAYYLRFDPKLWQARQPYAPLGTLYAAAWLRAQGPSVALFDAMMADSIDDWRAALARTRPRLAVIYEDSFNYLSKMCLLRMREAALRMIDLAREAGRPVVVSGSDATDHPELYLKRGARAVILGEGEVTLAEVSARILSGGDVADVPGAAWRDAAGVVRRGAARPFLQNLDELPRPAWDLVDVEGYRRIWRARHGYHSMNLATTRGCPFHCNWCAKPIYGQRYTVRSARSVVDEIEWIVAAYAPDHLAFVDDVFGLKPGWVEAFSHELARRGLRVPFRCLMRADQVTADVAADLSAAGCRTVWMGAESGSQAVLDAMEKGIRVDDIRTARRRLGAVGIDVGLFLQFGYPGESWDDVQATLRLVNELAPDDVGVSVSYPLPGTPFYDRVRRELGPKQNWVDSADLAMMYRASFPPGFYRSVHQAIHRARRLQHHGAVLGALGRQPWRASPADLRRLAAWVWNRVGLAVAQGRMRRIAQAGPVPRLGDREAPTPS